MLPLIEMGVMAGMSLIGSASQNRQAGAQFVQNAENVTRDFNIAISQIQDQAKAQNDAIRLEMANLRFEGLKGTAVTSNAIVEREIAGNTAKRAYEQSIMNKTMAHNVLAKKAEDAMLSFGVEMENKRQEANNAIYSAQATAMANTKSGISMVSSAIGAGMSGYSMGVGLSALGGGTDNILDGYKSVSERNAVRLG